MTNPIMRWFDKEIAEAIQSLNVQWCGTFACFPGKIEEAVKWNDSDVVWIERSELTPTLRREILRQREEFGL